MLKNIFVELYVILQKQECSKRARVFAVYWTARGQVNVRAHKADDTSLRRQNSRPEALDKGLR